MQHVHSTTRDKLASNRHSGYFGAARLLLSVLVIVGHTPELIYGSRDQELLTMVFGTLSFGELAVTGFFLISGYLLTISIRSSASLLDYFIKRVARIYPAFIVASIVCLLIVAPLAGAGLDTFGAAKHALRILLLQPPSTTIQPFSGAPYPALNGAMWTIAYEFACYVGLAAAFCTGVLKRRSWVLASTILLIILMIFRPHLDLASRTVSFGDQTQNALRFAAAFAAGVSFRLYVTEDGKNGWIVLACLALLPPLLTNRFLAEPALIVLGGYVLFWVCELQTVSPLSIIGQKTDLSYGIYLYGWPLQNLLIWKLGLRNIVVVDILAIVMSAGLAFLSWNVIEKPAMQAAFGFIRRKSLRRSAPPVLSIEDAGAP